MELAARIARLGTETAFEVLARARALEAQGRRVVHLEIGEPDFPTPPHVVEVGVRALRDGHTRYCPSAGLPELREACAAYLSPRAGAAVPPRRVLVAPGAKPFLLFGVLATCGAGDEVVYPDPGFPIYESVIRFAGATPVPLPLRQEHGFAPAADDLAARLTPRTRLVILNSPGNPTGGVVDAERNAALAAVLAAHPAVWLLSDEVYSELLHEGAHDSPARHEGLLERTILVESFSKTFAMTGWRLGYAALPEPLVEPVTRLLVNSVSCTAPAVQLAGVAALAGPRDALEAMRAAFRTRRDLVVERLRGLAGVRCALPHGAFYAFPDVRGTGLDADDLAGRLLVEAGVALLSGTAFGAAGAGHLRLSFATSVEQLEEGLAAMQGLLERVAAVPS